MIDSQLNFKEFLIKSNEKEPVPIVGDAAIANERHSDGKFILALIIDTSNRPDIDELVKFQEFTPNGDVRSSWGWRNMAWWEKYFFYAEKITLFLRFERPSEINILLDFDIAKNGNLVDAIIQSQAVFLQPGRKGDRVMHDLSKPKLMAEIPCNEDFKVAWEKWWHEALAKRLRKSGIGRNEAVTAAIEVIKQTRKILSFRMKRKDLKDKAK